MIRNAYYLFQWTRCLGIHIIVPANRGLWRAWLRNKQQKEWRFENLRLPAVNQSCGNQLYDSIRGRISLGRTESHLTLCSPITTVNVDKLKLQTVRRLGLES